MADVDIEASPDGLAHDFLLILRLGPIEDHAPPAATPPRQGHGNDFVHLLGREFAVSSTISRTRLAPRRFRMLFSRAPREGSRLSLVGPLGFFQLTFQVVNFSSQPLSFTLQPLSFPLPLFALRFPLLLSPPQYFVFLDRKSTRLNSSHSQISYAVFCLKKKKTIHIRQHLYYLSDPDPAHSRLLLGLPAPR